MKMYDHKSYSEFTSKLSDNMSVKLECSFFFLALLLAVAASVKKSCWGRKGWLLCLSLVCGLYTFCHCLFAIRLGVIERLCFVTVALPGRLLYYLS